MVLGNELVHGAISVGEGLIAGIDHGSALGEDLEGDYLIPGLVELHTDALETHYSPRPGVRWHAIAAVQAHDAQIAASGITTVFDALRVGTDETSPTGLAEMLDMAGAVDAAQRDDRLRAQHVLHLRCEVSAPDCAEAFESLRAHPLVRLTSLMDHAPGQRQFATLAAYRDYYQGKLGMADARFEAFSKSRTSESRSFATPNRLAIAHYCREHGIALASHDDATDEHVAEAVELDTGVAEFPTTLVAAQASRRAGIAVMMGAPNVVRGGSHSGNISASALVEAGLLDILSSDYIPFSLIQAAFQLGLGGGMELPAAIRLVTDAPARAVGLNDRGQIAIGKRADLVRVKLVDGIPIVRAVWRQGQRVI